MPVLRRPAGQRYKNTGVQCVGMLLETVRHIVLMNVWKYIKQTGIFIIIDCLTHWYKVSVNGVEL